MAGLPMIETGYKPEFGLGALYQGFNAANADQSAQEELIKQFLANQHAQVQNPLDEQTTAQNLLSNHYKTEPEYQTGMRDMISGQGMSNLTAGENAVALQPFKKNADRREEENRFRLADQQNGIYQLDDMISTEQNPLTRMAMIKERERITRNLKESPKFMGQRELKETGTESQEYRDELKLKNAWELAQWKASQSGGTKPAKTFEETIQRILDKVRNGEELTDSDKQAWVEASAGFNAKNAAKVQPGNDLDPNNPALKKIFVPKPPQETYTPQVGGQISTVPSPAPDLRVQVEASGIAYEPTKYEYRVVNGKVQRKAKGN